jgi:hypothetical protein
MGLMVFLNGVVKLLASVLGMVLAGLSVEPTTLIALGGLGVIVSGFYSLWQWDRERKEGQPKTITEFEEQFSSSLARHSH